VAYYAFCIPVVFYFSYDWGLGKGVLGIWQGFGAANLVLAAFFFVLLFTTDLDKESLKIVNRVKRENELQ
jgi:MATE family multidrug resistance protein